jgi:hypothetical protein
MGQMNCIIEISRIVAEAEDGVTDPLMSFIALKQIDDVLQASIKQLHPLAMEEAEKYGEKTFNAFGATITRKANAGRWSFEECSYVAQKKDELKQMEDLAKQAYQAAQKGKMMVDDQGEVIAPAMYKHGADNISIKINAV